MTTYGQYFNPQKPDNRFRILLFMLIGGLIAAILLFFPSCNSVKKTSDINKSRYDSSATSKVDSSSKSQFNYSSVADALKVWDTYTEFKFSDQLRGALGVYLDTGQAKGSTGENTIPLIVIDGDKIYVSGPVKSFSTGSKGKDSSSLKMNAQETKGTELNKESEVSVQVKEKSKTTTKESSRSSPILWLTAGLSFVAVVFFYFLFKRK